jgi:anti-sigma factor RsiW
MSAEDRDRVIGGVLGPAHPAHPELTCDECFEALDRYVELELADEPADERVPGMAEHLQGCPACAEEHASLVALLNEQP